MLGEISEDMQMRALQHQSLEGYKSGKGGKFRVVAIVGSLTCHQQASVPQETDLLRRLDVLLL